MATSSHASVTAAARNARRAASVLAGATAEQRNRALLAMADALVQHAADIVAANAQDLAAAEIKGTRANLLDRLRFDQARIFAAAEGLRNLAAQPDPLDEVVDGRTIPGGIRMVQVRVPLGVVGMIYEARPNVTVDAAGIGIKTGNAMLLRGGSLAAQSNEAIGAVLATALESVALPAAALQIVDASSRDSAHEMMAATGLIDVLIPRGGAGLIATVVADSQVPVIETGTGNCHVYIDRGADLAMATRIVVNAKTQRTSVCNAAESLVVDAAVADEALAVVAPALIDAGVTLRCDDAAAALLRARGIACEDASEEDFGTEYLDLIMSVKVVPDYRRAVDHINRFGTHHSEAIVTEDLRAATYFQRHVDAACVYVNVSTRFTDGAMFGLGAEIGISTQKLHARGPMGLTALTTTKYLLTGDGQVRE